MSVNHNIRNKDKYPNYSMLIAACSCYEGYQQRNKKIDKEIVYRSFNNGYKEIECQHLKREQELIRQNILYVDNELNWIKDNISEDAEQAIIDIYIKQNSIKTVARQMLISETGLRNKINDWKGKYEDARKQLIQPSNNNYDDNNDAGAKKLKALLEQVPKQTKPLKIAEGKYIENKVKAVAIKSVNPAEPIIRTSSIKDKYNTEAFANIEKAEKEIKARQKYIQIAYSILDDSDLYAKPLLISILFNRNKYTSITHEYGEGYNDTSIKKMLKTQLQKMAHPNNIEMLEKCLNEIETLTKAW